MLRPPEEALGHAAVTRCGHPPPTRPRSAFFTRAAPRLAATPSARLPATWRARSRRAPRAPPGGGVLEAAARTEGTTGLRRVGAPASPPRPPTGAQPQTRSHLRASREGFGFALLRLTQHPRRVFHPDPRPLRAEGWRWPRPRPPSPVLASGQRPGASSAPGQGPAPLPPPLRPFQQRVDHSGDVGEAPARGRLLLQDVVGLAQGLLGGGAQVKSPCPGARPRRRGVPRRHCDAGKLPAGNRKELSLGTKARGQERPGISRGKRRSRQAGTRSSGANQEQTQTHTHTEAATVCTVYTQRRGPSVGPHIPYKYRILY